MCAAGLRIGGTLGMYLMYVIIFSLSLTYLLNVSYFSKCDGCGFVCGLSIFFLVTCASASFRQADGACGTPSGLKTDGISGVIW